MKPHTFTFIGDRLKQLRGAQSQADFAKKIGVPFRTYQRYEAGERVPKKAVLNWIASACGVSVDWILTGMEPSVDADRVAEAPVPYGGKRGKIVEMLHDLDDDDVEEIFRLIQKAKQAAAWRREHKLKEGA